MNEDERASSPEALDGGEGTEVEDPTPSPWANLAKSLKFDTPSAFTAIKPVLPALQFPVRSEVPDLWSEPFDFPENPAHETNELLERMLQAAVEAEEETRIERERAHKARVLSGWLTAVSAGAALAAAAFTAIALWG